MMSKESEESGGGKRPKTHCDFTQRFLEAVRNGKLEECKMIVEECPKKERRSLLNYRSYDVRSFLHVAIRNNRTSIVSWFLTSEEGGARSLGFDKILTRARFGETALHLAVGVENLETCKAIVNALRVDNGERKEMLNAVDIEGWTVLHFAADDRDPLIASWLLSEEGRSLGFNSVLARTKDGETTLHIAVRLGYFNVCKAIVNGCRVDNGERQEMLNAMNNKGWTALHCAAGNNRLQIVSWVLSEAEGGGRSFGFDKILAKTNEGETALHLAVSKGDVEACKAIINGCRAGNGELQQMINSTDVEGRTALHLAANYGRTSVISWLLSSEEGGGRSLGFNNSRMASGETVLHLAALSGRVECCEAIVNGCQVGERQEMLNAVNNKGWTVLHCASLERHITVVSWLLSSEEGGGRSLGFNKVLAKTNEGETALHFAARGSTAECFKVIVDGLRVDNGERDEMLNAVTNDGMTILHEATQRGGSSMITWILSEEGGRAAGFNLVTARTTKHKLTALDCSVQSFLANTTKAILSHCTNEETMNLFLAADPENGWTALHRAVGRCSADAVIELLSYPECGLIVNRKDNEGMTALHRAIINPGRSAWSFEFNSRTEVGIVRALLGSRDKVLKIPYPILLPSEKATTPAAAAAAQQVAAIAATAEKTAATAALIDPNIGLGF